MGLGVQLLSHQVTVHHEVQSVSVFSFLHHVLLSIELLLLHGIVELFPLSLMHIGKDFYLTQDIFVVLSPLYC
jgi:hypothetical protein